MAQTVPDLRVSADFHGAKYLNNVRVNGILCRNEIDLAYVLGMLNGPVANFVFKRIGKPKQGGWYEANKQFIAPLPIPNASREDRADVASRARELQRLWTARRELLLAAEERLSVLPRASHPVQWLWPDLPTLREVMEQAPRSARYNDERETWAKSQLAEMEAARRDALQARLDAGESLTARFENGELRLFAGGIPILSRIYLDDATGQLAESYWRYLLLSRDWRDAKSFQSDLRRPPSASTSAAATQFMERVTELAATTLNIAQREAEMNEKLYKLYGLTPEERALVENERN